MPIKHTVRKGEGLSSLCLKYGFEPHRIWDDPENSSLKSMRPDPNILYDGDVVAIPDEVPGMETGATGRRHRFRRRGVPAMFRLQMLGGGEPRRNEPFTLIAGARQIDGVTDNEGRLAVFVPNDVRKGTLLFGAERKEYQIDFGSMDPLSKTVGVQKRLINLGYDCGALDGVAGPLTETALRRFQATMDLPKSGEADEATVKRLRTVHDTLESYRKDDSPATAG